MRTIREQHAVNEMDEQELGFDENSKNDQFAHRATIITVTVLVVGVVITIGSVENMQKAAGLFRLGTIPDFGD